MKIHIPTNNGKTLCDTPLNKTVKTTTRLKEVTCQLCLALYEARNPYQGAAR